jgi:hypothetical protein
LIPFLNGYIRREIVYTVYWNGYSDSSIFLFTLKFGASIEKNNHEGEGKAYMRIVEERIHPPGERLHSLVHVLVVRSLGQMAIVFVFDVLCMRSMLRFDLINPRNADGN